MCHRRGHKQRSFRLFLIESVGQRGSGRFVDDAFDVEAGDLAGILRRVTLRIVEVGGNRDDGFGDFFAQLRFRVGLELGEDHRRDFLRRESLWLAFDLDLNVGIAVGGFDELVRYAVFFRADFVILATHEALHRENGVCGVRDRLALGGLADQAFAGFREGHDRWCCACSLGVLQHDGLTGFHHRHARVGCS